MDTITLGDAELTRVVEWSGTIATAAVIVPDSGPEIWRRNESWLAPDYWNPGDDGYVCRVQTWVVRSGGRTILIDTGVGDDRERPQIPEFSGLRTGFLDRLRATGVRPEDVNVVINTHIHNDHVGWNTSRQDDQWVPTFPNATYLMPRLDHAYFNPDGSGRTRPPKDEHERSRWAGNALIFGDSIDPILRAGQAVLWEGTHRIDDTLTLEAAPGHTPGSSVVRLRSGTDRAVFVGDILHSPVQILKPDCNSCFCDDPERAASTRRAILERAADEHELVVPAHFGGAGAAEVRRDGSQFAISRWAPFGSA